MKRTTMEICCESLKYCFCSMNNIISLLHKILHSNENLSIIGSLLGVTNFEKQTKNWLKLSIDKNKMKEKLFISEGQEHFSLAKNPHIDKVLLYMDLFFCRKWLFEILIK